MPGKKAGVRSFAALARRDCKAGTIDKRADAVGIVGLAADENFQVVLEADKPAIEHPMDSARQRQAIVDDVGTAAEGMRAASRP